METAKDIRMCGGLVRMISWGVRGPAKETHLGGGRWAMESEGAQREGRTRAGGRTWGWRGSDSGAGQGKGEGGGRRAWR